jgi:hypothetical protein
MTLFRKKLSETEVRNAYFPSVENLLSSSVLLKHIKVKLYRTIILPVLCGCETWSLTLSEERKLSVFKNRVLRRIFRSKRDEVTGSGENYRKGGLVICISYQILFS